MREHLRLYSGQHCKQLDQVAINQVKIPGSSLMARAGQSAFEIVRKVWPSAKRFAIVCGSGNNAGDGYQLALALRQDGFDVNLYTPDLNATLSADAQRVKDACIQERIAIQELPDRLEHADLIVDALLGTGIKAPLKPAFIKAIQLMNESSLPVLALDVPSGLDADTGQIIDTAVKADVTVTFVGQKYALLSGPATNYSGIVHFDSLELTDEVYDAVPFDGELLQLEESRSAVAKRLPNDHKGRFGHVLIMGAGHPGYSGALVLAGQAALVSGAGLVSAITHDSALPLMARAPAEMMIHPVTNLDHNLFDRASAYVVGPGLGQDEYARTILTQALGANKPMVIDADGLNLLDKIEKRADSMVLTPHPKEAARLLGISVEAVEANRVEAAKQLHAKYKAVIVLKGAGTIIAGEQSYFYLCPFGNPGMATGGMGDVLAGLIGGLLAQGLTPLQAAKLGVVVHAQAGDLERTIGEVGMQASDLMLHIRSLINNSEYEPRQDISQFFDL